MTITAWRVTRERFADTAFDGEGARLWGGRWNSRGLRAVYASATTSLALLETLVHADLELLSRYVTIPVTFENGVVSTAAKGDLPDRWRDVPVRSEVQRIGDRWIESLASCVLEVPSVIVPHESNFLLNPGHPDFESLEIGEPFSLDIDARLG